MSDKPIRVVIAKPGLDGHDRGAKVVSAAMRDAGFEVIYLGLRQTPEMIVKAAIEEDADVIALSIHSGSHMTQFTKIISILEKENISNILVTGGGIIPDKDKDELYKLGVGRLFGPGTPTTEMIEYIKDQVEKLR